MIVSEASLSPCQLSLTNSGGSPSTEGGDLAQGHSEASTEEDINGNNLLPPDLDDEEHHPHPRQEVGRETADQDAVDDGDNRAELEPGTVAKPGNRDLDLGPTTSRISLAEFHSMAKSELELELKDIVVVSQEDERERRSERFYTAKKFKNTLDAEDTDNRKEERVKNLKKLSRIH